MDWLIAIFRFFFGGSKKSTPTPETPAPTISATRTLRRGSFGDDVRELQRFLKVTVDGYFGPKTEAAVKVYQRENGLTVDGVVGPVTRSKMLGGPVVEIPELPRGSAKPETVPGYNVRLAFNSKERPSWSKTVFLPARGKFVTESHYATTADYFPGGRKFPETQSEGISDHLGRSLAILHGWFPKVTLDEVYPPSQSWTRVWTPPENGKAGQGSVGELKPTITEEIWQGNMMWAAGQKPNAGTKFLIENPANGKSCVIQMGYETGPGSQDFLGGVTREVHWYLGASNSTDLILHKVLDEGAALGPVVGGVAPKPTEPEEPDRPSVSEPGEKLLSHPLALKTVSHKTQGTYRKGYPEGLIVHFTAGQCDDESDMVGTMEWGKGEGYAFWGIGPTGKLYESHPLNKWGHHAGTSSWPSLGSSVSKYLLGVEIASAGRLDSSRKSWFGKTYPESKTRTVKAEANRQAGTYLKYTDEQEETLIALCLWLKRNNPEVFNFDLVLGHDEVSPGRKNDPGGALSMTMPEFRELLKRKWAEAN